MRLCRDIEHVRTARRKQRRLIRAAFRCSRLLVRHGCKMSGAPRSYPGPEATSPQDSLNGLHVKVELRNGHQVSCKLSAGSVAYVAHCVNCGYYALKWATLRCGHRLCEGCFMECEEYFCRVHQVTTMKFQANSGRCQYTVYKDVLIKCPCCSSSRDLYAIAIHIEISHPKFVFEESSATAKSAPQNETECCGSKDQHDKDLHSLDGGDQQSQRPEAPAPPQPSGCTKTLTEDDSLDSPQEDPGNTLGSKPLRSLCSEQHLKQSDRKEHLLGKQNNRLMNSDCGDSTPLASTGEADGDRQNDTVSGLETCPYCYKQWERQEIEEHVFDCSEQITECPECLEHIKKVDYEEHVIQCCIKEEEKKAGGCARVKKEEDGKSEDKKRDDDIQEIKTKIQGQNIHYKFRTVMCPLCEQEVSRKALAEHLNDTCEQRFLKCRYCSLDVEACHLQDHMDVCEEMPATCHHCKKEFNTFAELRDEHLAVCPLKPVKCPYYRLGCNFQATNKETEKHTASCKQVTSFIDRFLDLEEKFLELRLENEGLRKMISKNEEVNQLSRPRSNKPTGLPERPLRQSGTEKWTSSSVQVVRRKRPVRRPLRKLRLLRAEMGRTKMRS
ncbi:uncharacterized protein [Dermacentor albipictus]|uniref:uncharacterized protein isoform X3 n=1 Tax=Dermacentor albipictus TaxID=60249 RepID=UPI0038FC6CB0